MNIFKNSQKTKISKEKIESWTEIVFYISLEFQSELKSLRTNRNTIKKIVFEIKDKVLDGKIKINSEKSKAVINLCEIFSSHKKEIETYWVWLVNREFPDYEV